MREHSRGVSGERRLVDISALVDEALNLAYHGACAQDQSFNITLGKHFSIAVVSCQASSSPFVHFPTVIVHRLARFSLLSEVGAMAAT